MISWLPSLATTLIAMGVALYLWQHRSAVGARPLMALMVAVAWWSLGYALEFRSPGVSAKVWWVRFEYLGVVVVPPLWLAFALRFTGRERWLNGRNMILLAAVPLATLLLVWTNDLHHLMWTSVWLDSSGPFPVLAYARAPGFWLFVAFAYLLLLAGTILLVQEFIRSRHLLRQQVGILLFGVTAPWLGNALYVSGLSPLPHLDLTPFALTLTGLACAWGLFRFKLMTLVPIGREAVMEATRDAFLVLDNQGRIVDLNAAALEIVGRRASGVVGRSVSEFFPEGPAWTESLGPEAEDRTEMALGQGEARRHYDLRLSPLFGRRGESLGRLVILRDITDQKRAEEERHRQLNYLQSLQAIDQVIRQTGDLEQMLTEVIEQVFLTFDCDRAWLLYPCDPDAPSWRIPFETTRPEYPGALAQNEDVAMGPDIQALFRSQLAVEGPLTHGAHSQQPLEEARKRYGVQSQMGIALHPRLGKPWLLGVHQCSHARVWTQEEQSLFADIAHRIADAVSNLLFFRNLQESEERFRSLSENAPDLICTLDRQGDLTYVNPAWERILGNPPEEMIGRRFVEFVPQEFAEAYLEAFRRIRDDRAIIREERGRLRHRDGSSRWFSMSGAPNFDSQGRVIGLVAICKDMTEQRGLEIQLRHSQKMEAVGTLAGGIAHDFNNLLQAITGYAQLLSEDASQGPDERDYVDQIERAAARASDLVRRLLQFSRKDKPELTPVDLNHEVRQAVGMLERTIPKMIRIETELQGDLWTVDGDPSGLERILMNLGANARDAMPEGGRLVMATANVVLDQGGAETHWGLEPGRYVRLTVSDTGGGMSPEEVEHIFEPFFTTKEVGRGTGLGLSTVYGVVKAHGGHISCASEPGRGTTFTIYLPARPGEVDVSPAEVARPDKIAGGHELVLVVDDEPALQKMAEDLLRRNGYQVLTAASGEQALEIWHDRAPEIDLVVLDLDMPGMGGQRCLEEILEADPLARVMIASGYFAEARSKVLLDAGAVGFLGKPYNLTDMLAKVREVLDGPSH